jgi:hypothetical protein
MVYLQTTYELCFGETYFEYFESWKYKYRCIRVYVWFKDDKHVIWMWIWFVRFITIRFISYEIAYHPFHKLWDWLPPILLVEFVLEPCNKFELFHLLWYIYHTKPRMQQFISCLNYYKIVNKNEKVNKQSMNQYLLIITSCLVI